MGKVTVDRAAETLPLPSKDGGGKGGGADDRPRGLVARVKGFLKRHKTLFWWLHSFYALFLGFMVILFAQKGFDHARVLAATLGGALLGMLVLFRIFGQGAAQKEKVEASRGSKLRFLIFTYVLKNLYQPMLFFVLPFYWKASSLDSVNGWFIFVMGLLALLSTMDLIFDHFLMRHRVWASVYYGLTLFACVNLVLPAFLPNLRTVVTLGSSAAIAVLGFFALHFPFSALREKKTWAILAVAVTVFSGGVVLARRGIPPVPLYLQHAAVGPELLPDGRLAVEVSVVHVSKLNDLYAVTDVALPGGEGDDFVHVWRFKDGDFVMETETDRVEGAPKGAVRLRSTMPHAALPASPAGRWTVDVQTADGQLVGRARFEVIE